MSQCKQCHRPMQQFRDFCCRDCADEWFDKQENLKTDEEENDD